MKRETKAILFLIFLAICAATSVIIIAILGLPSLKSLEQYQPRLSSKIYYADGSLMAELGEERRTLVTLNQIPLHLRNATIAIEDERFFQHRGIDIYRIFGAALKDILHLKLKEGASTITQQLARSLFLTQKKTFIRKIREVLLSLEIERRYTKEQILEMYLNQVYYGSGAYGVSSASRTFFGKDVSELNLAESALLASLPRAPNAYSPFRNFEKALQRQKVVLHKMKELGFITPEEENKARNFPISIRSSILNEIKPLYLIEFIRIYMEEKYGSNLLYKGGLEIYTTVDPLMQITGEKVFREGIERFRKELKKDTLDGALISMDPLTGEIKAMVGGYDFRKSQFNRAVQAHRQPGSAFKPFVYLAAMDNGYRPDDTIVDTKVSYYTKEQGKWEPQNYDGTFHGTVTLRTALALSLNVATIRLLEKIGPQNVIPYAIAAGIKSPLGSDLSLALGTYEVTPLEITRAFATIANHGIRTEPYVIRMVKDSDGRILEENSPKQEEVLSARACELTTELMRGVVEYGTARYLKDWGFTYPCAGKTGTTDNYTDAWFIGFTPTLVTTVYVGCDLKQSLGNKMTGAVVALPIWAEFMKKVYIPPETSDSER